MNYSCAAARATATTLGGHSDIQFVASLGLVNRFVDAIADPDLYEADEPKPSGAVIVEAANTLGRMPSSELGNFDIEPYWGEINFTWRRAGRRVKASFIGRTFSVYREVIEDGRVTSHHLEPNTAIQYLKEQLVWLNEGWYLRVCDEEANFIGEPVPDHTVIFRACTKKTFLVPSRDAVSEVAFQKNGLNHKDGLSLAVTPEDAVESFSKNHGVIRIRVGAIHELGRNLQVRFDSRDQIHVLIRNLPCMDRPAERERAEVVSAELALRAEVESATPYPKRSPQEWRDFLAWNLRHKSLEAEAVFSTELGPGDDGDVIVKLTPSPFLGWIGLDLS